MLEPQDVLRDLMIVVETNTHLLDDEIIRRWFDKISTALAEREVLREACALAGPAMLSLMDELGNRKATGWGLVNEALVRLERLNRQARAALGDHEKEVSHVRTQAEARGQTTASAVEA